MNMHMGAMSQRSYLHFGTGDLLWFQAWGPTSSGAIVGACIGLALLAMFSRLLVGIRGVLEAEWRRRLRQASVEKQRTELPTSIDPKLEEEPSSPDSSKAPAASWVSTFPADKSRPFIPSHDVSRGIAFFALGAVEFTLMMAIMSWNAAYTISIILGLGIGETLFGRLDPEHNRIPH